MRHALIVGLFVAAIPLSFYIGASNAKVETIKEPEVSVDEPVIQVMATTTEEKIIQAAEEAGIDPVLAVQIAFCESSLNPLAANTTSTAKGLYQFTDTTWKWIGASGDQFDEDENIRQFMKWYPTHPDWWECN